MTPARYTWTVGQPANCDLANITLTPTADGWVDQVNPVENYVFSNELEVRSSAVGDPTAVPPEPVIGENARALVKFGLPTDAPNCRLESATLRLYAESSTARARHRRHAAHRVLQGEHAHLVQPAGRGGPAGELALARARRLHGVGRHASTCAGCARAASATAGGSATTTRTIPRARTRPSPAASSCPTRPRASRPSSCCCTSASAVPPPPPPELPAGIEPTEVHCGEVIKEHTLVANDLTDCLGEGLVDRRPEHRRSTWAATRSTGPTTCSATSPGRRRASPPASGSAATTTSSSATAPCSSSAGACCSPRAPRAASWTT